MLKLKHRVETLIKPVTGLVATIAFIDEHLKNLRASPRDREMVTKGIVNGVINAVSAYSIGVRDGKVRDEVRFDIDPSRMTPGRMLPIDVSGGRSVTDQIDRACAALLRNLIDRFTRRGRRTEVDVRFTPDVYGNPDRYSQVSRALGTQPLTGERPWKGGGKHTQATIIPAKFEGVVSTTDSTYRRPPRR